MVASKRLVNAKSDKYHGNINRRGRDTGKSEKRTGSNVGPILLGFFLFVVVGSALLQIVRTATSGPNSL